MLHQLEVLGGAVLAVYLAAKQMFPSDPPAKKDARAELRKKLTAKKRLADKRRREQIRRKTRV